MTSKAAPLFSIVTINLNMMLGLARTYHSIAAQTAQNYEWVVIDGASKDGSVAFLKNETNMIEKRTIISEADGGLYEAMNKGIRESKGEYILFLNAGDELAGPDVLSQLSPFTENAPDFIYGDSLEPTSAGREPFYKPARPHTAIHWGMFTHHQAMLYSRKRIIEMNLQYSLLYDIAGDYDFTARFLKDAKAVEYAPKPICIFEQGGISQRNAVLGRQEQFLVRDKLDMVTAPMNVWIFLVQTLAWNIRKYAPGLYKTLKKRK